MTCVRCLRQYVQSCRDCTYILEPHPHHTLLASFGEDTAETEKDIDNAHMWCEVYTLFAVIHEVALEPLIITRQLRLCSYL